MPGSAALPLLNDALRSFASKFHLWVNPLNVSLNDCDGLLYPVGSREGESTFAVGTEFFCHELEKADSLFNDISNSSGLVFLSSETHRIRLINEQLQISTRFICSSPHHIL
jgi:hypothetical protein